MRSPPFAAWPCLALACGGDAPRAVGPGEGSCADAEAARARVVDVADENGACSTDADCTRVAVRASCFEACPRAVNASGRGAVDRASTLVEAGECKRAKAAACQPAPVTCPPADPPRCRAGRCT